MFAILLVAIMVARGPSLARTSEVQATPPPMLLPAPALPAVVVRPQHKDSVGLLPVVDQDDILPHHRMLADQVLRSLPSGCRDHLKNFYVNYDENAANRGLGGESTIIVIGTVPDDEFKALIAHECGHVHDLGALYGTMEGKETSFYDGNTPIYANDPSVAFYAISWISTDRNQLDTKESDFVSGYAASDPFEDFAEAYVAYALQKDAFKSLATENPILQSKYDFMEHVVFAETEPFAHGTYIPEKDVPWDITRLPYVWHAKQ